MIQQHMKYQEQINDWFGSFGGEFLQATCAVLLWPIEVASVIELSEASGRVAAGLFMTEG